MKIRNDQRGITNQSIIMMAGAGFVIIVLIGLNIYAFSQLKDARVNRDRYAADIVAEAKDDYESELQAKFIQKEKEPYLDFDGPDLLGGISFKYPKIWSGSLDQTVQGSEQINAYFHPGIVRTDNENERSYAFRLQLINSPYSDELRPYLSIIKKGEVKVKAVTFNDTEGVRLDGQLEDVDRGSMVILPLRDKTLKIWTESEDFLADFDTLLESFKFNI